MCRGSISHNSRVSMGVPIIRTKIKAKGGVIIRLIGLWMEEQSEQHTPTPSTSNHVKQGDVDLHLP